MLVPCTFYTLTQHSLLVILGWILCHTKVVELWSPGGLRKEAMSLPELLDQHPLCPRPSPCPELTGMLFLPLCSFNPSTARCRGLYPHSEGPSCNSSSGGPKPPSDLHEHCTCIYETHNFKLKLLTSLDCPLSLAVGSETVQQGVPLRFHFEEELGCWWCPWCPRVLWSLDLMDSLLITRQSSFPITINDSFFRSLAKCRSPAFPRPRRCPCCPP